MTLFITSTYLLTLVYFCLLEVGLEEGQSGPRLPYSHPLHKSLGYFLIPLLIVVFVLVHETICIIMMGSTHHTSNPVIYIPLVSPTTIDVVTIN